MASSKKKLKITGVTHVISVDKKGDVVVNHPGAKDVAWKKKNLTKTSGAKTVKQGVKVSKAWHKEKPHNSGNSKKKK